MHIEPRNGKHLPTEQKQLIDLRQQLFSEKYLLRALMDIKYIDASGRKRQQLLEVDRQILRHINLWTQREKCDKSTTRKFYDDRYWMYDTALEISKIIHRSISSVKYSISKLERLGYLLVKRNMHWNKFNKVNYYSINYDKVVDEISEREYILKGKAIKLYGSIKMLAKNIAKTVISPPLEASKINGSSNTCESTDSSSSNTERYTTEDNFKAYSYLKLSSSTEKKEKILEKRNKEFRELAEKLTKNARNSGDNSAREIMLSDDIKLKPQLAIKSSLSSSDYLDVEFPYDIHLHQNELNFEIAAGSQNSNSSDNPFDLEEFLMGDEYEYQGTKFKPKDTAWVKRDYSSDTKQNLRPERIITNESPQCMSARNAIKQHFGLGVYIGWFMDRKFVFYPELGEMHILCDTRFIKDWLKTNYLMKLVSILCNSYVKYIKLVPHDEIVTHEKKEMAIENEKEAEIMLKVRAAIVEEFGHIEYSRLFKAVKLLELAGMICVCEPSDKIKYKQQKELKAGFDKIARKFGYAESCFVMGSIKVE